MTPLNDLCDFCGHVLDPIGCDTQMSLARDILWCGQCESGLIYKHRLMTDFAIEAQIEGFKTALAADGLSWGDRGDDTGAWITHLRMDDEVYHMQREQRRRGEMMEKFGNMLKTGYTFWSEP